MSIAEDVSAALMKCQSCLNTRSPLSYYLEYTATPLMYEEKLPECLFRDHEMDTSHKARSQDYGLKSIQSSLLTSLKADTAHVWQQHFDPWAIQAAR